MSASLDTPKDDIHKNGQPGSSVNGGGYRPTRTPGSADNPLVNVQPPKREDLQPSYAQMLGESDTGAHGWYGSMSKLTTIELCANELRLTFAQSIL